MEQTICTKKNWSDMLTIKLGGQKTITAFGTSLNECYGTHVFP